MYDFKNLLRRIFFVLVAALAITGCSRSFNKVQWMERDVTYLHRESMLDDLLENYQLKGLTEPQLIDLLGKPDIGLTYFITEDYGSDIDPISSKKLVFYLNKDGTIESFEIQEWKK